MWVYGGILIHPLCCIFIMKLYTWPLHRIPTGAPGPLIPCCLDWFFESVVGRILDSGCWLNMVVGFEFYSPCCTSYLGCLQLVTMAVFLASYPWWYFTLMSWRSRPQSISPRARLGWGGPICLHRHMHTQTKKQQKNYNPQVKKFAILSSSSICPFKLHP
jgi:hypothetical protein